MLVRDQLNVGAHLRKIMTLTLKESIKRFAFIDNFHRNFVEKPLEMEEQLSFEVSPSLLWGFPVAAIVKNLPVNAGDLQEVRFISLGREDPQRRKWQPTPVFLPGEPHEQRSLVATVHGIAKGRHASLLPCNHIFSCTLQWDVRKQA